MEYHYPMNYLKNNLTGEKGTPLTEFVVSRKNDILECLFIATDSSLESYSDIDNDDLWKGNVVELFLDLGDEFYYEFEVAPNNKTFVATIINRKITFIKNDFFSSEVEIENNTYKVKMRIDLSKLDYKKAIKYNAFRVEKKSDGREILLSLNPTLCETFHIREKFIPLD